MLISFDELNPKQKQVVKHEGGPLFVLAGPGTGKTTVLTHHAAYLIAQKNVSQKEILAITFTKKAANEMLERLKEFEDLKATQPHVSTLHAESLRMLSETGLGSFEFIADDDETFMLMKDASDDLDLGIGYRELKILERQIEFLKANNKLPNEIDENGSKATLKKLYGRYEQLLTYNKAIDLGGLVVRAVRSISENYGLNVRHLLVDEYQDVNQVEYKLIQLLARDVDGLFVVGDDDQSIYGWRGADPAIIWDFNNMFKGARIETLEESTRCPEHILKGALGVVRKSSNYKHKPIRSVRGEGSPIHILRSSSETREARWVADWIAQKISSGFVEPHRIAILCPQLKLAEDVVKELMRRRIKVTFWRSGGLFASRVVRDILAYIRVFINRNDDLALRRCIESAGRGIGDIGIRELRRVAERHEWPLWEILINANHYPELKRWYSSFRKFAQKINELSKKSNGLQLGETINLIRKEIGATRGDTSKLERFVEPLPADMNLSDFLKEVNKNRGLDLEWGGAQPEEKENAVAVMSMHSAKGLTYDVIFIIGMDEEILPNPNLSIDEQRRLCYVAMTRARRGLFLCHANRRMGPPARGSYRFYKPSSFISDIPREHREDILNPWE